MSPAVRVLSLDWLLQLSQLRETTGAATSPFLHRKLRHRRAKKLAAPM